MRRFGTRWLGSGGPEITQITQSFFRRSAARGLRNLRHLRFTLLAMRNALAVALGGAAGSVLRYWMGLALLGVSRGIPVNTLVINVAGAFVLGVILAAVPAAHTPTRLLLATGFCGGFTTFSTFSAEV